MQQTLIDKYIQQKFNHPQVIHREIQATIISPFLSRNECNFAIDDGYFKVHLTSEKL